MLKIVLTGGPRSGKSTCLSKLQQKLTNRGYKVLIVSETATELFTSGVHFADMGILAFQRNILALQRAKECFYERAAQEYEELGKEVIIIYDRGVLDNKAYLKDKNDWYKILASENLKENELKNAYDGVFLLRTSANLDGAFGGNDTNATRYEDKDGAIETDNATIDAWAGHGHLRIIDVEDNFEDKVNNLIGAIYNFIGIPEPIEIERKFLVNFDLETIESQYQCSQTEILQIYLNSKDGVERRVRQRGVPHSDGGDFSYYYTEKSDIDSMSRYEKERIITKDEYTNFLMEADTSLNAIRKTRVCFVYENMQYELDIYPQSQYQGILEVEINSKNQEVLIPEGIYLSREVTEDKRYKNNSFAREGILLN